MWQDSGRAKYFYIALHSLSDWYSGISGNVCFRIPLSHKEIQEPYISDIDGMRTFFNAMFCDSKSIVHLIL